MEYTELLRKRRMVRSFTDRPLASAVLDRVVAAGLRGPSAGFTQAVDLLVLHGPEAVSYTHLTLPTICSV